MIRDAAKKVIGPNTRYALRSEMSMLRDRGVKDFARWNALLIDAALRERMARRRYRTLDQAEVTATRRSDTVFVYGSGASLNEVTPQEWAHMAAHDTFGFTAFIYQRWVRTDYHLIRGGVEGSFFWRPYAEEFCRALGSNPFFDNAILFVQSEFQAMFANQILGYGLVRPGTRIYRYHTARGEGPPTTRFADGIRHAAGTLCDAVNVAVCMGWQRIVLAGVDLYDSRYFYLPQDQTLQFDESRGIAVPASINNRGLRAGDAHNTVRNGVVDTLGEWSAFLRREHGVRLEVFNPRSLLAGVMETYARPGQIV